MSLGPAEEEQIRRLPTHSIRIFEEKPIRWITRKAASGECVTRSRRRFSQMEIARISDQRPLFRGPAQKRPRAADSGEIVCSVSRIDRWTAEHVDAAVNFPSLQQLRGRFYSGDCIRGCHTEVMGR